MKTKFTEYNNGNVVIEYTDAWTNENICRRFTCPYDGGYVWELLANGERTQVCERLAHDGPTLTCNSWDALPDLIKREYRRMRYKQKQYNIE